MNTMKIVIENFRFAFTLKKMIIFPTQRVYFILVNIRERFQFCILSLIRIMNYTFHDLFDLILFIYFLDETKRIS